MGVKLQAAVFGAVQTYLYNKQRNSLFNLWNKEKAPPFLHVKAVPLPPVSLCLIIKTASSEGKKGRRMLFLSILPTNLLLM